MPVPLLVAASATAASLAYLNAKSGFTQDRLMFKGVIRASARVIARRRSGQLNMIYELERLASSPATTARPFIIFEGKTFTYAEVYDRSLRYGQWLRTAFNVKSRDMVAMDFQNSETFIFLWFAIWSIGAVPAFINYNLTGKSLSDCIRVLGCRICLVDPDVAATFDATAREGLSADNIQLVLFSPEVEIEAASFAPVRVPDAETKEHNMSETAIVIFTSGTTGLPKPAIVAWSKVWFGGTMAKTIVGRGEEGDVMYTSMPLYHTSAALMSVCSTIIAGATQALGRKFSTKTFWDEVRASRATSIQYVGETLRYLLAAPPQRDPLTGADLDRQHSVKVAFGNGLRPDIWNRVKDRFGIGTVVEFYAATDGPAAMWLVSKNDFTAGAIGRMGWLFHALVGRHWSLVEVDPETDAPRRDPRTNFCVKVAPGQPGEMLYRLPSDVQQRFQGYFNNPGANDAKIMRDVFAKGDAYFRTGDVLRWDSDGRIFFNDRIGDTFRWKSENVSTTEVSEAIGMHPAVREANVYGVRLPHHDGRAGCVAICFDETFSTAAAAAADDDDVGRASSNPGAEAKGNGRQSAPDPETLRSLAEHIRATLPSYARPLFLRLAPLAAQEQTTGTNKQQKHHLREAGVRPASDLQLYWLRDGTYVPFGEEEWRRLQAGRVKL
ncbi:Fatty acid transporter protein [Escovopsis weberi]|uniref:Very long-chain fatty acid transport protein n=1 Tax=Escovopsis weberi TaxID=150374 RepID=A0A0M9VWW2_ESCWE|nr:Fatty acid transporter protein [Escovopsis weberi]